MLSQLFHVASVLVLPGWVLLAVAPRWRWTYRITTFILTLPLAAVYMTLFAAYWNSSLSFGSLDSVYAIFQEPAFVLAGWIHYLVFDLFVGSWEVCDSRQTGIPHLLVIPCLVATFLVGPIGLLAYLLLRFVMKRRMGMDGCPSGI
jgi:hypothetical protein